MKRLPGGRGLFAALGLAILLLAGFLFLPRARSPENAARSSVERESPDVVLITIDTLRFDALGFSGNREVETPNLDRLAREGLVFDRAHASNVVTLPSHVNILTGLYPHQHGVRDNTGFRLDPRFSTLATLLKEKGYTTGAFVAAFPLDHRFGLNRGCDVYDDRYAPGSSPYDFEMQERPGTEIVAAAGSWYENSRGKKRFLWVHLFEPHAPYRPPPPFAERFRHDPYLGEVSAADAALEPLLSLLRQENALVVMTSDHGEARGGHGELTHGLFAYEETLHVPLVLWSPGRIQPGRTDQIARHVDIFPTVLGALGLPIPSGLPGHSLLSPPRDTANYFEAFSASLNRGWAPLTGVLDERYKYIDLPVPELYDLHADPEEKTNLFARQPEVARRLKKLLPQAAVASRRPDSEETRRLLSLGYLSGSVVPKSSYTEEDDPKRLIGLDNKIHRIVEQYQSGHAAEATTLAREIVRERPEMSVGYEFLGFLLQQSGRDREAAEVLQTALRKGLASESMRVRLALILSGAGRPVEALTVLKPLAESGDPDTQNALGIALADGGRIDEALKVFQGVLQRDPSSAIALQNAGIALLKRGEALAALDRFDRALAISQKLPRALNARGVAQAQLGRTTDAIASWRRAAELDPKQYDALFNIGLVASRTGNQAIAREALERFVKTAPPGLYRKDLAEARRLLKRLEGV